MKAVIEVNGLRKDFGGGAVALESLTLSVPSGSLYGFLGPNGSGKSTTVGCMTGLLDATSGSVRLFGSPFDSQSARIKQRVGVMPENLGLFDYLYAHEFLQFQGRMFRLGRAEAERRANELIDVLELRGAASKPIGTFSSGMRKRLAFAAAIIHSPQLLFLDEPFESIDPAGVALMKHWLREFVATGKTVFLTTHMLDTVERFCDRATIIRKGGEIVWSGELGPLQVDGTLHLDGKSFTTLESLYLHLTGERYASLDWL